MTPGLPGSRQVEITIYLEGQGVVQDMQSFARAITPAIKRQFGAAGSVQLG